MEENKTIPLYHLEAVSRIYQAEGITTRALDEVTLDFPDHGFVAILGPSGCGKTTLLNLLGGLDRPTSGEITIDGVPTSRFHDHDWDALRNRAVGFVFQNYDLIAHLSVFDNVALTPTLSGCTGEERMEAVMKALRACGVADFAKKKPGKLSGGQQQRVAIARALVNDPRVILADEPTGALDQENSRAIMALLKEIARTHLVVMVTHNESLALSAADRRIDLLDGKVVGDHELHEESPHDDAPSQKRPKGRVRMSFFTALKLSLTNLSTKWLRTVLLIFAGTIGMIATGLVFCVSQGVSGYLADVQERSIGSYPITITSNAVATTPTGTTLSKYPSDEVIHVRYGETVYDNYDYIPEDYLTYLDELDPTLYKAINYNRSVNLHVFTMNGTSAQRVSMLYELYDDEDFIGTQYDLIAGTYPQGKNEVLLIVDAYNAITASTLSSLGFTYDPSSSELWTFSSFLGKEYVYVANDHFYQKSSVTGLYSQRYSSYDYTKYVNEALSGTVTEASHDQTLSITGIIRPKATATLTFYYSGLLYTHDLTSYAYADAKSSAVVTEQSALGLTKNVFTGEEFKEEKTSYATFSAQYNYDYQLYSLGAIMKTTSIRIYTSTFDDRLAIESHLDGYVESPGATSTVSYTDYYKDATVEFATLIKILTTVLIIFASISLVVAVIMIAMITYISVIERRKEIGILRSIGARSRDVGAIFIAETTIVGFFAGLFGILGCLIGIRPINAYVQSLINQYGYTFMNDSEARLATFKPLYAVLILVGSIVLTTLAGVIPAIVASRKKPVDALREE